MLHTINYFIILNQLLLTDCKSLFDDVNLSGIPLTGMGHDKTLQQTYGVTCVVSVVENFEINSNTLAGQAINGNEWKRQDIEHGLFSSPDFYPPSFDLMNIAADFMAGQFLLTLLSK